MYFYNALPLQNLTLVCLFLLIFLLPVVSLLLLAYLNPSNSVFMI